MKARGTPLAGCNHSSLMRPRGTFVLKWWMMHVVVCLRSLCLGAAVLFLSINARSQANLPIYTDHLVNGFQDWSWGTRNFANTSPVHSGTDSISHSGGALNTISFEHPDFNATLYSNFTFLANSGNGGGQILSVYVQFGATNSG